MHFDGCGFKFIKKEADYNIDYPFMKKKYFTKNIILSKPSLPHLN